MRDGWVETTLGDVAEWFSGGTPKAGKAEFYENGTFPWVVIADMMKTEIFDTASKITKAGLAEIGGRLAPEGSVLISMYATVGRPGYAHMPVATNQAIAWSIPNLKIISSRFLLYVAQYLEPTISSMARGATQRNINRAMLREFSFNCPPLVEQKRIVDLVSSFDAYIDSLQQQVDSARVARNAVLHELLSAGGDDWTETTIGEVLLVSIGGIWGTEVGTSELDVNVYRQTEFNDNGKLAVPSDATRSISVSQLKSRRIQPGDILLQKSAGTPSLPGRVVQVPLGVEDNATCSNFLQLLRADSSKCDSGFLFWELWSRHKSGGAFEFQRGTNIRNLDLNQYFAQPLNLPPLLEQKRIVEIISSMDDVITASEQAVVDAKNLRSGLLADLLSGEHEIPKSYDQLMENK
jgi:restriction endonuclease S subunit